MAFTAAERTLPVAGWHGRLTLAAVLWLVAGLALAQPPINVTDADDVIELAPLLDVLEDPSGRLTLDDIRSAAVAGQFRPLPGTSASFGFTRSTWWLRVNLRNPGDQPQRRVLRQSYPMLDHLQVWVIQNGHVIEHWETGDRLPFSSRPIEHRDFLFPLLLAGGAEQTLLIQARSDGPLNVPLSLYQPAALLADVAVEHLALGALFGSILLLATCILVLFLFVRDASFLFYLCYVLSYGSYMAAFNGIAYQHVLPDAPDLASLLQVLLLLAAVFFLLQFSRGILATATAAPRVDRLTTALQVLIGALALASPFFSYAALIKPISTIIVLTMLLVMTMGVASHRAGQPTARFFLLAWSAFLIGVLAYMLKSFGLLPHNFLTQYGFQIGTLFEFVLLSMALGVRVQEVKQQSRTDSLSGLGNRAHFDEQFAQQFAVASASGAPLALLIADIDNFKQVNDLHGHAIGDRTLQRIAAYIGRAPRQTSMAFRYGGEEFAILLPRTALDTATGAAERLCRDIAADEREPRVTISIGVACSTTRTSATPRDLFRAADEALYAAKRDGRNRVVAEGTRERRSRNGGLDAVGPVRA